MKFKEIDTTTPRGFQRVAKLKADGWKAYFVSNYVICLCKPEKDEVLIDTSRHGSPLTN